MTEKADTAPIDTDPRVAQARDLGPLVQLALSLHAPADVDDAYDTWGAACGPAAVAALCGTTVNALRPVLGKKAWANPTDITNALTSLSRSYRKVDSGTPDAPVFPTHGLAFVQIAGPWLAPGVPVGAAYRHTHWIATIDGCAYDINIDAAGGWRPIPMWRQYVAPELVKATKRATGWYVRNAYEVLRAR